MLDIKLIRERPDFVKGELAKRGVDPAEVDRLIEVDQKRRKLQGEVDQLRADRKRRAREVGKLPAEQRAAEIAKIRAEEADEEKLAASLAKDAVRVKDDDEDEDEGIAVQTNVPLVNSAVQLALAEKERILNAGYQADS